LRDLGLEEGASLASQHKGGTLRRRMFEALEHGPAGGYPSRLVSGALLALIVVNVIAVPLNTVPELSARHARLFFAVEVVSVVIFTVEYLLRLWVAAEPAGDDRAEALRLRLGYARSLNGIVDLVAIVPFWIGFFLAADLRAILVFRIFRFLKFARYSVGIRSLFDAVYQERRPLAGCLLIFLGTALLAASLMYLAEREAQPDKFGTIPHAMWWAVATLGTVGYGDVVPVTWIGRTINSVAIICAIVMIALPVGIIATAFSQTIHNRDFVASWGMIARVPLFEGLKASEIADICRLLRTETVEAGAIVARRGEPAHSMYFIVSGEVEIELPDGASRLRDGHFFGEVAVLRRARRSATVRATERTRLLILDADDLHPLMRKQPDLARRMRKVVQERVGSELITPDGDIVREEIDEDDEPPRKKVRRRR
jgi:voltage-gated potassium channel